MKRVCIFITSLLLGCCACHKSSPNPNLPQFVVVDPTLSQVIPVKGEDGYYVAYELFLSNFSRENILFKTLTVSGENFQQVYNEEELREMFAPNDSRLTDSYKPFLEKGESGILFILLSFTSKEAIPPKLDNTFIIEFNGATQNLFSPSISVDFTPPIRISAPLMGEHCFTPNAIGNDSDHRRALLVIDGEMTLAQRFAVDWLKFDEEGRWYQGDPKENGSYYGYGQPLIAVADGEIVMTNDGVRENIAGIAPNNLKLNTVMGNFVSLKINENTYALYAHLIPGSLKVKTGDRVKKGQIVGLLGNSGNSTAPHLHFQITDKPHVLKELQAPSPIFANGIPFMIDHFVKENYIIKKQDKGELPEVVQYGKTREVTDEIIMNNDLVNFSIEK